MPIVTKNTKDQKINISASEIISKHIQQNKKNMKRAMTILLTQIY